MTKTMTQIIITNNNKIRLITMKTITIIIIIIKLMKQ